MSTRSVARSSWPAGTRSRPRCHLHRVECVQHVGARGFALQFHAGRGSTGLEHGPRASAARREQLRQAVAVPKVLLDQTRTGLRRSGTRESIACMAAVTAFAACNALGQVVGALLGAGRSPRHLE